MQHWTVILKLPLAPSSPSDPPEVRPEADRVHSGEGFKAQLTCLVFSDPLSEVRRRPSRTAGGLAFLGTAGGAYTTFSDQLWTICMEFGKSATNFDSPAAESCPNGRRNEGTAELPCTFSKMHALPPKLTEKGVVRHRGLYSTRSIRQSRQSGLELPLIRPSMFRCSKYQKTRSSARMKPNFPLMRSVPSSRIHTADLRISVARSSDAHTSEENDQNL